jgi:3-oxoacyl-[acyl-carrier-protein] synthase II
MKFYIRSTANISPQDTFGSTPFLKELIVHKGPRLNCLEPDYKEFIDTKLLRRMSRIIKMGVAAASACLKEANVDIPDAILVGTAYGCLEDTGVFLTKLVEQKEELLTPTAFIQSTHNTVAAQIALMLHCHNYNNTYVHRGFSFESALLDATLLLNEKVPSYVLAGGLDEITDLSQKILERFGLYKRGDSSNENLYSSKSKGTIAGEGAAFFLLSNQPSDNNCAELVAIKTFYKPKGTEAAEREIISFLNEQSIHMDELDLILTGENGSFYEDGIYRFLEQSLFRNKSLINFKHLCGEYPTATAFALWLGAKIIKTNAVPLIVANEKIKEHKLKNILIYNHYQNIHHSLLLISAC